MILTPRFSMAASLTRDRARPETAAERVNWARSRKAESQYAKALKEIARHVGEVVRAMAPAPGDTTASHFISAILNKYADIIRPWATVTAARMLSDVSRRDEQVWATMSKQMGRAMSAEVNTAPTGAFLKGMLDENVGLITSLPIQAARRVHELTLKGLETGSRAEEMSQEILRTGDVTKSRAMLIARTEVARTASGLVEARAVHIGSEGYIWRSSEDGDVRNTDGNPIGSHRLLNGKYIRWDSPPVASTSGERAHAGQIYNCRCYPEPVIPDHL